jgi:CheR methyltransferase, SAM binding domain
MRRVAVVGPGLDFANKEKSNDFYPPQTIQPFAVLDSLIRLGLADAAGIELYTLDISQDVNPHIARTRENSAAGRLYTVQLPWNTAARHDPGYRIKFVEYWKRLGDQIGQPVTPITVPQAAAETQTRAVRIRPEIVTRITPVEMNIIFQRMQVSPDQAFDLIIGTNIFVYYGEFEQSPARANVAAMLKPGGYLLTNDKLPGKVPSSLEDSLQTKLVVARDPDVTEYMFCHKRIN